MDFKAILRTFLKIILPLAFGCLLLWYLYSKMDIGEIWNVIRKGVRYEIILFSLLFGLGANIVRGLRWGLLIRSLGDKVKTCNVIYAVLGNYAVNLVLPRVGEVWRCGMITKYDKIPFTRLLGTLLIDRVSDTIMVGLITMSIIIFNFDFFHSFFIAVRVDVNQIDAVMLIIFFQSPIECQCIHAVFDVIHLCEHIKVNFCAVLVEFIQISSGSFAQAVLFIWRNVPAQIQLRNNHI